MFQNLFLFSVLSGVLNLIILVFKNHSLKSLKFIVALYIALILAVCEPIVNPYLIQHFHWYVFKEFPVSFIHFPMIYFYLTHYLNVYQKTSKVIKWVMYTPMIIDVSVFFIISAYCYFYNINLSTQTALVSNASLYLFRAVIGLVYNFFILGLTIRILLKFRKDIERLKYKLVSIQIFWVVAILFAASLILFINIGYVFSSARSGSIGSQEYLYMFNAIFVVIFGYLAISVPNMVEEFTIINEEVSSIIESNYKPLVLESKLVNEDLVLVFQKITVYMNRTKAYTNSEFTMQFLAKENNESVFTISTAINHVTGNNFYYYLNSFRIKRLVEMFSEEKNEIYTIESIALMCGFKSKTTLYKYCKLILDKSPSDILKAIKMGNFDMDFFNKKVNWGY